jgi:hypothetical protein
LPVKEQNLQDQLLEEVGETIFDPLAYAERFYPWGAGALEGSDGPRKWQREILGYLRDHISNPATRYTPCKIAVSSGHGIGKSAFMGMVTNWAMSACEDCKGVVTAGTGTQLSTKTVPEISKWFKLSFNAEWFDVRATSIRSLDKQHELAWRVDFVTWSAHNTDAFAGLHNKLKLILLIYDEASAIDDAVWQVSEGALTDEETIIIWLAFGNPTKNTGSFRECFGKLKHRWKTYQIDSRTVEGTNKEQIAKWIEDYGEDSDFVRVRVRGEFPRAGSSQFIGSDVVAACRKYKSEGHQSLPKIISVDVARFGADETVVILRQGRKAVILARYRGKDTAEVGDRVIEFMQSEDPQCVVIDGDGVGGGVVDHIKIRGFGDKVFEFHGGAAAYDATAYFNRRSEVWGLMRDWLKNGAEIPDNPDLDVQLTALEYGFSNKGQIQLESKADLKKRSPEVGSPDLADALAMSFSVMVAPPAPKQEPEMYYPSERNLSWLLS